ncbi:hypothetical protein, partial [Xanthomonas perforans]|uniref:hypothetical protein n=1 Tax=Xanthomonas perforans TaxID=442694 RepID=UPI0019310F84
MTPPPPAADWLAPVLPASVQEQRQAALRAQAPLPEQQASHRQAQHPVLRCPAQPDPLRPAQCRS